MTSGPVVEVDVEKLWQAVNYRLYRTSKHANEVAHLLGFGPQVLSDIKAEAVHPPARLGRRRYQPSSAVFVSLCWWLDADPRVFYRTVGVARRPRTPGPVGSELTGPDAAWLHREVT